MWRVREGVVCGRGGKGLGGGVDASSKGLYYVLGVRRMGRGW